MPIIEQMAWFTIALTALTVAVLWVDLKLVKWSLNASEPALVHSMALETGETVPSTLDRLNDLYRLAVAAIVILWVWPGLASWSTGTWHWIMGFL